MCSALEARSLKEALGSDSFLVCPGIRPAGGDVGDQSASPPRRKRCETAPICWWSGDRSAEPSTPVLRRAGFLRAWHERFGFGVHAVREGLASGGSVLWVQADNRRIERLIAHAKKLKMKVRETTRWAGSARRRRSTPRGRLGGQTVCVRLDRSAAR